jgi:hypothetical protein
LHWKSPFVIARYSQKLSRARAGSKHMVIRNSG